MFSFRLFFLSIFMVFLASTCLAAPKYSFIGDSVMEDAMGEIDGYFYDCNFNTGPGRQLYMGVQAAGNMAIGGELGDIVVVSLGTNGPLYEEHMLNFLRIVGSNRKVFWINNYCPNAEWQDYNNNYLTKLENSYPNFVVIDWYGYVLDNKDNGILSSDNIHLTYHGCNKYALYIYNFIQKVSSNK